MKTKSILFFSLLLILALSASCNKDDNNDNPATSDTYMRANINGTKFEAQKAIASYSELSGTKLLTIVGLDENGQNGLELQIENYHGEGNYNIDENIVFQRLSNAYINPGGNAGFIKITSDNGVIYKGTFECNLVNVVNPNDKLAITNGEFKASSK